MSLGHSAGTVRASHAERANVAHVALLVVEEEHAVVRHARLVAETFELLHLGAHGVDLGVLRGVLQGDVRPARRGAHADETKCLARALGMVRARGVRDLRVAPPSDVRAAHLRDGELGAGVEPQPGPVAVHHPGRTRGHANEAPARLPHLGRPHRLVQIEHHQVGDETRRAVRVVRARQVVEHRRRSNRTSPVEPTAARCARGGGARSPRQAAVEKRGKVRTVGRRSLRCYGSDVATCQTTA